MLVKPLIHLNGSDGPTLLAAYRDAARAVYDAGEAVARTSPHARDYYPMYENAFTQASQEHRARCAQLRAISRELEEIVEDLYKQLRRRGGADE